MKILFLIVLLLPSISFAQLTPGVKRLIQEDNIKIQRDNYNLNLAQQQVNLWTTQLGQDQEQLNTDKNAITKAQAFDSANPCKATSGSCTQNTDCCSNTCTANICQ